MPNEHAEGLDLRQRLEAFNEGIADQIIELTTEVVESVRHHNIFVHPRWTRYQLASIEPAAAKAPYGGTSASRLVESGDNGAHFLYTGVTGVTPGQVHTFSVYFQPDEGEQVHCIRVR